MRQPQYTQDRKFRIISLPNGLWQLQRDSEAQGTRTSDPWEKRSHAVSLDEVKALLRSNEPVT